MSTYYVTTVRDVEEQTVWQVEADSEEEAVEIYDEGEVVSVDYEPTGDTYPIEARKI